MAKKTKVDPTETRLRQVITEVLLDMTQEEELSSSERADIVKTCMDSYGPQIFLQVEALLALTMREMAEDEDLVEEEGEDDE